MKYKAILRTGYDGWHITYTEFEAFNKFKAFEKLLKNFDTALSAEAIQEENITDFETLVNIYSLNANCDGGDDEILLLLQNNKVIYQSEFAKIENIL